MAIQVGFGWVLIVSFSSWLKNNRPAELAHEIIACEYSLYHRSNFDTFCYRSKKLQLMMVGFQPGIMHAGLLYHKLSRLGVVIMFKLLLYSYCTEVKLCENGPLQPKLYMNVRLSSGHLIIPVKSLWVLPSCPYRVLVQTAYESAREQFVSWMFCFEYDLFKLKWRWTKLQKNKKCIFAVVRYYI